MSQALSEPVAEEKRCANCGVVKPLADYYTKSNGRQRVHEAWCKKCSNQRVRSNEPNRVIRNRARQRATTRLVQLNQKAFEQLMAEELAKAYVEAATLAKAPAAKDHFGDRPVLLRPGARMATEGVTDRIDVGRCPDCIKSHDRGHTCLTCGSKPGDPVPITPVVRVEAKPVPPRARPNAWVHKQRPSGVDETKVDRAIAGQPVQLNTEELAAAVETMYVRGSTQTLIAKRLRMSSARIKQILKEADERD
jgi:hypothetical protein